MKHLKALAMILLGLFVTGMKSDRKKRQAPNTADGARSSAFVNEDDDGADSPADVNKRGWKEALKRTKQALRDKNITTAAAGLAYYATITFFPAVLGLATVYTSVAGGQALLDLIKGLEHFVPDAINDILHTQLSPLANARPGSLGIAAATSLAAVLWTTSGGFQNLVKATNIAYEVRETRGLIKLRLVSVIISLALMLIGAVILVLLLLQGDALTRAGFPEPFAMLFPILRWPLLVIMISLALSLIYRYAPNRQKPKWSWVSWGATAATIIWLVATVLFFFYTQNFGNFNKSYGTFASIIIMMVWFNVSALIILVGAQVNKKLEEVTSSDTIDRS